MKKDKKIRLAIESDVESILEVYTPFITDTVITFEYKVPTVKEFGQRMAEIQQRYPWFVCEVNNNIVGYAYASRFNEREAYDWSADFSIYIRPEFHRRNIGKALYYTLFETLKLQGYYNAYAGVTLPNIKSEGLHESFGFKSAGVYHNVGYKLGSWHDVKWYELKINEHIREPLKPKNINEISSSVELKPITKEAEKMIKLI